DIAAGEAEGTGLRRPRPEGEDLDWLTGPGGPVHDRVSVGREPRRANRALAEGELAEGRLRSRLQTPSEKEASGKEEGGAGQDRGVMWMGGVLDRPEGESVG